MPEKINCIWAHVVHTVIHIFVCMYRDQQTYIHMYVYGWTNKHARQWIKLQVGKFPKESAYLYLMLKAPIDDKHYHFHFYTKRN